MGVSERETKREKEWQWAKSLGLKLVHVVEDGFLAFQPSLGDL